MLNKVLRIRISVMGMILFAVFALVITTLHQAKLTPGELALFSVNSFLFGYYFAPLLAAQKGRVASLITAARQEEMVILDILTQSHMLSKPTRHEVKTKLRVYLESIIGNMEVRADNPYYNELLYYTKQTKDADEQVLGTLYDRVGKTQANRDAMNNLFSAKVYSHEWLVATTLFSITLYFALQTDFNHSLFFGAMLVILCTGLSMLMVILVKFATLTHKEAKRMWQPLRDLLAEHFDDVTAVEAKTEKARIDEYVATQKAG